MRRLTNARALSAPDVAIGRRVAVLALFGERAHQTAQLLDASFGSADRHALFALGIGARLARIQPILHGAGEQAVGDVPDVGLVVGVRDPVTEVDGFAECFAEWV